MNKLVLTLLASAFFAAAAGAAEEASFSTLDQNRDGAISADEAAYSESLTKAWQKVDANADGMVDEVEFSAFETIAPATQQ